MKRYQNMGYINTGFDEYEGMAPWALGYQEYEGQQQAPWALAESGLGQTPYYTDPMNVQVPYTKVPMSPTPGIMAPSEIPVKPPVPIRVGPAGKHEPFIITPGGQGQAPTALTPNVAATRTEIFVFTIPQGLYLEFNPADKEQEIILTPFSSTAVTDATFVVGELDVLLRTATGGRSIRIHHSHTVWHRPASNVSSVGNLRRWHHYAVGAPGDTVVFRLNSATALVAAASVLAARVRVAN